jgi:hypothetical protein
LAIKRGFLNAKTGRPDVYKTAIFILNDYFLGKIPMYFKPDPKYFV